MKKIKNKGLFILLISIFIIGVATIAYRVLQDENQLTLTEKRYITNSKSNLLNIQILNNSNIFGKTGQGLFYDFLNYFEKEKNLKFNKITVNNDYPASGLALTESSTLPENSKIIYTDHYVLIAKTFSNIYSPYNISGIIGILNKDVDLINHYLSNYSLTYQNYNNKEELETALANDDISYILVPRIEYYDTLLSNLYNIVYHFSDIKNYYYINYSDDAILNSIINKTYNVWSKNYFEDSFYENEYSLFTNKLKITEKELDVINSKDYTYGFIKREPYDILSSGTFGGIINKYLYSFSKFSNITFNYKEYSKLSSLLNDINKNKVNLYVDYYGLDNNLVKIDSEFTVDISFVMSNRDERVYTSLTSLANDTIYVKENTLIANYLITHGLKTKTYKDNRELKKLFKNNEIVAMDYMEYLIFKNDNTSVNERFRINSMNTYNFISNNDTMFNRLFYYFTNSIDKDELLYSGIDNYSNTVKSGKLIYAITKYALLLILIISGVSYFIYKFSKRIHIKKRIKKSDKIKYIDMLTSLKNRNFLSENLSVWNQNTIFPQAIIVIDLNGIQELNDTYGYIEGDKQIQALANILIKTQLDNTEIIRTDGNEFTIYMVGYSEKHVLSYIKKLNKELKSLPHDKGAAIGFSMIENDLKLIDDAINEATEIMKKNKEMMNGEEDEEKI